jgi:hypothetical protein
MEYGHDDGNLHLDDVNELKFVISNSPYWINACWVHTLKRVPQEDKFSFGILVASSVGCDSSIPLASS